MLAGLHVYILTCLNSEIKTQQCRSNPNPSHQLQFPNPSPNCRIQENDDRAQRSDYAQQFRDAVEIHGDVDAAGNEVELTCMDYTLHCISLPWKLLFAIVPPVHWYNGKLAFGISLMMIGALTG